MTKDSKTPETGANVTKFPTGPKGATQVRDMVKGYLAGQTPDQDPQDRLNSPDHGPDQGAKPQAQPKQGPRGKMPGADGKQYKLTQRQEGFAVDLASGMTQADAYRANYSAGNMTPKSIHEQGSKTAALPKVAARVAEIMAEKRQNATVTADSLARELQSLADMARTRGQISAAVRCIEVIAKLHGLGMDNQRLIVEQPKVEEAKPDVHAVLAKLGKAS